MLGGISIWQLLIILAIVVMLFGTSRLKNIGSDLGTAIKGFKSSIKDDADKAGEDSADSTVQTREQADDKNGSDSGNDNDNDKKA
jgi:sec-independent protein translocase protein TatA